MNLTKLAKYSVLNSHPYIFHIYTHKRLHSHTRIDNYGLNGSPQPDFAVRIFLLTLSNYNIIVKFLIISVSNLTRVEDKSLDYNTVWREFRIKNYVLN